MSYTRSTARALAVSAAGLGVPRPPRARSTAEARRRALSVVSRMGYVQLDSVNVLARAQDMVLHARVGALPPDLLTTPTPTPTAAGVPDIVEQWAHEAAVVTPEVARLLAAFPRTGLWGSRMRHLEDPAWQASLEQVMERLSRSPATALGVADEFADGDRERRHLFETCALHAFHARRLVGVGRTAGFQRILADPHRLWPQWFEGGRADAPPTGDADVGGAERDSADAPLASTGTGTGAGTGAGTGTGTGTGGGGAPDPGSASLELTRIALRGLGIARTTTVADWFRLSRRHTAASLSRLESRGLARQVTVEGTRTASSNPWWVPVDPDEAASAPSRPDAPAGEPRARDRVRLLSPFDHLVAHRPRLEELFGVRYRIGIYTPAPDREFGYYDLLVLDGTQVVGRIDLRAERAHRVLAVAGFWLEPAAAHAPVRTARAVVPELRRIARWQGLTAFRVEDGAQGAGVPALARLL